MQELETYNLINCTNSIINEKKIKKNFKNFNCNKNVLDSLVKELMKRIYLPTYILILALTGSLLVIKSKNSRNYISFKTKIFLMGISFLVISEISLNYTGINNFNNFIFVIFPIISFFAIYQFLNHKLKVN